MTKKQKRFVDEYLIDLNITQAAIRAGYSPKTAYSIGSENLKKPEIRACIEKAMAERSKRTGINQDRIIMELAKIGLLNPKDLVDFDARIRGGKSLAKSYPVEADLVTGVPESGIPAAKGFSEESGIPFGFAFYKFFYHYFIIIFRNEPSNYQIILLRVNFSLRIPFF